MKMMSRTVRVCKLMYIVAGILISNEEICNTIDRIQIAPRVEVKTETLSVSPKKVQGQVQDKKSRLTTSKYYRWLQKFNVFRIVKKWREFLKIQLKDFNVWTIPNYLLIFSSSYISKKLFFNRDCDIIYK